MGVVGGGMSPECAHLCPSVLSHLKDEVKSEGHSGQLVGQGMITLGKVYQ